VTPDDGPDHHRKDRDMAEPTVPSSDLKTRIAALEAELAQLQERRGRATVRPRHRDKLSDAKIKRLTRPGFYSDGRNLYLDFRTPPGKAWVLRYTRDHVTRDHGLGPYPTVSLAEAREARDAALKGLRQGVDPIDAKRAARVAKLRERITAMSFAEAAEAYFVAHEKGWRSARHAQQWESAIRRYALPLIGGLPVAEVDRTAVLRVLEQDITLRDGTRGRFWDAATETANRTRGRIELVLSWAQQRDLRPEGKNPAAWRGNIEFALPARRKVQPGKNFPAMPYAEVPAFMAELAARPSHAARALAFTILTATRTGDVLGAPWDPEIDLDARTWSIPAERMKARKEHRVPLSDAAIRILREVKELKGTAIRPFPLGNNAMIRQMPEGISVHGFRSAFRDWAAEETNVAREVAEQCLAHTISNATEAAYRRGDLFAKRRLLMEGWAKFLADPPASGQQKVVPIRRRG
jgi:integrase